MKKISAVLVNYFDIYNKIYTINEYFRRLKTSYIVSISFFFFKYGFLYFLNHMCIRIKFTSSSS
jgi:hypothetical protein